MRRATVVPVFTLAVLLATTACSGRQSAQQASATPSAVTSAPGHEHSHGMDMTGASPGAQPVTAAAPGAPEMPAGGVTRTYFISADPVRWNYAPLGRDAITGKPFDAIAKVFVQKSANRIGSTYDKCVYRSYSDSTFAHRDKRQADDAYLGLLGPTIHAEVGDTISIVFRNTCSFDASMHAHGVFYDKDSEGAPYADGTKRKADDAVPLGGRHTYTWLVPERAGPAAMDGSSVLWMYHSHTDEIRDGYSGLIGALIVTAKGKARPDGTPSDVDRELVTLFSVMDENNTHYIDSETTGLPKDIDDGDEEFAESNLMHSINGYVYGNGPVPTVKVGQKTRWYTLDLGTEVDLHTPHWHGNTLTVNGMRMDMTSLLPGSMVTADMVADNPGIWLYHCHVNDHIAAGMQMRYRVVS